MRKVLSAAVTALIITALFSCRQYHYVYSPSKLNTPLLRQKGDSRLNASFSGGGTHGNPDTSGNSGLDVQAAYAITNHWGVIASFDKHWERDLFSDVKGNPFMTSNISYRRRNWELGTGLFAAKNNAAVSIYGGVGFGKTRTEDVGRLDTVTVYSRFLNFNTVKYFLQPGFTVGRKGKVRFDFSLRYSLLRFAGVRHSYSAAEVDYFNIRRSVEGKTLFLNETSFALNIPVPQANWLCLETSMINASLTQARSYRGWNFSIGLTADLRQALNGKQ